MKAPIKVGLPPGMRSLYMERHPKKYEPNNYQHGFWLLWIHTSDHIHGTFMRFYDNGKIERVTVRPDEGDQIDLVKPADGE